jgi:hypothetical protein
VLSTTDYASRDDNAIAAAIVGDDTAVVDDASPSRSAAAAAGVGVGSDAATSLAHAVVMSAPSSPSLVVRDELCFVVDLFCCFCGRHY